MITEEELKQLGVELFGDKLEGMLTSCAAKGLREIDFNSLVLNAVKVKMFHSILAKLLFITKRARPDIELTIGYICTIVRESNVRDWIKLQRALSLIKKGTIDD